MNQIGEREAQPLLLPSHKTDDFSQAGQNAEVINHCSHGVPPKQLRSYHLLAVRSLKTRKDKHHFKRQVRDALSQVKEVPDIRQYLQLAAGGGSSFRR